MTIARAERYLLERLGAGTTVLLAVLLELPERPSWADGVDADGRAVALVGRHALGESEPARTAISTVLDALAEGTVPEGALAVAYAPAASRFIAEAVAGAGEQVLGDGPRGSGKTQAVPAALAILAERHARAGFPLPLRALWLHDTLKSASEKTGQSLEAPMWAGGWQLRDDRQVAALTIGGVECVRAAFVGAQDAAGQERARAECAVLVAEELCSSLEESAGNPERVYDTGRSSMRLETRRHVAIATTNPGDEETWPHRRWIEGGGQPGCVRCPIPASDRLTPEDVRKLRDTFRASPDLEKRLALGEWTGLKMGEAVGEGYDPAVHVAPGRLQPRMGQVLAIGWDGGHSPSAVIGQLIGGQVQIFASLNDLKVGVLELIEDQVIPWLVQWAPWARRGGAGVLVHIIDPSMATAGQATIKESAERMIRETLRGRIVKGPVAWSPRREAVLRLLAPRHEQGQTPLLISGTPDTLLLRQALSGRWYYPRTPDGRVDRSRPKKPNSPASDIGDSFAYLAGWLRPGHAQADAAARSRPTQYAASASADSWRQHITRGGR